jgi:hypothetical protein
LFKCLLSFLFPSSSIPLSPLKLISHSSLINFLF